MNEGVDTWLIEVKFFDQSMINCCVSFPQICFLRSRTKVKGSKMIRYHRSLNLKRCRQMLMMAFNVYSSTFLRNHKPLGSGGSIVARLKLKVIDGRAPPGVELAA